MFISFFFFLGRTLKFSVTIRNIKTLGHSQDFSQVSKMYSIYFLNQQWHFLTILTFSRHKFPNRKLKGKKKISHIDSTHSPAHPLLTNIISIIQLLPSSRKHAASSIDICCRSAKWSGRISPCQPNWDSDCSGKMQHNCMGWSPSPSPWKDK